MTTLADVHAALLARIEWGARAGAAVELRPGGPVTLAEARAHVSAHAGPVAAGKVVALPALREQRLRPVPGGLKATH